MELIKNINTNKLLELILKNTPHYVLIINTKLTILYINRAENAHPEEWVGKSVLQDAHPEDYKNFKDSLIQSFKEQKIIRYFCRSTYGKNYHGKIIPFGKFAIIICWPVTSKNEALTFRESQILGFVKQGKTSKEIAEILKLSKNTIDQHRKKINRKLA